MNKTIKYIILTIMFIICYVCIGMFVKETKTTLLLGCLLGEIYMVLLRKIGERDNKKE